MMTYQAIIPTTHASRYLQQLCKHWSHRFEVTFDPAQGVVRMPTATCLFGAEPDRLVLRLESEDVPALPRLCDVVTEHLKRFAFREELDVSWSELGQSQNQSGGDVAAKAPAR
jgi:hypothetical protein